MIVLVKDNKETVLYYFKHKLLRYYLCIVINKLKGKEVIILNNEGI